MSIHVLSWVMQNSEATGTDRLVLLALADYANDDGGGVWASVDNIGRKARAKRRSVQYALRRLQDDGHITAVGKTPHGTTVYRLNLQGAHDMHPPVQRDAPPGVQPGAPPPVQPDAPKPSNNNRPKNHQKNKGERFAPREGNEEDAAIVDCFAAWHDGLGLNGSSYLSEHRAAKIRTRLKELAKLAEDPETALADARATLIRAAKGMCTSKWHRREGHTDFGQLFRDGERVMFFLQRLEKTEQEEPDAAERFSQYDAQIENRRPQ